MKAIVSHIECGKVSRVKGPSIIRMVDERKKTMCHFGKVVGEVEKRHYSTVH